MDPHYQQWLSLFVRWLHVITGIAWIGSSFYFNWLDGNLRKPERKVDEAGLAGELWSVHGGGFYVVQKYSVAPSELPKTLHWFKWEAYTTWLSGFCLLVLVYYMGGAAYLLDEGSSPVGPSTGVAIGVLSLLFGWLVYHGLADTRLVDRPVAFASLGFVLVTLLAYGLTQVFTNRAAYIHVGAMLGTIMAANVFFVIIPGQRRMVDAMLAGKEPDGRAGARAKQRSLHNNYITLPVLFIMVSNHYPITFDHTHGWAVLAALSVLGAGTRHWFNLKNKGHRNKWILPVAALGMLALAVVSRPRAASAEGEPVAFETVWNIVSTRCATCHSSSPTDAIFTTPPSGVVYDTPEQIRAFAEAINQRAVLTQSMPLGNRTQMTTEERQTLGRWIAQGARIDGSPGGGPSAKPATTSAPSPAAPSDPAARARQVFEQRCAVCHGSRGAGDGAAAQTLSPKPRALSDAGWQKGVTDEYLRKVILEGGAAVGKSPAMPGNLDLKREPEAVDALVRLVRSFGE